MITLRVRGSVCMLQGKLDDVLKENKALSRDLHMTRGGKDSQSKQALEMLEAERSKREEAQKQRENLQKMNSEVMVKASELAAQKQAACDEALYATRAAKEKEIFLEDALAKATDLQKQVEKLTGQLNHAQVSVSHLEAALDAGLEEMHCKEEVFWKRFGDLATENEDFKRDSEGLKAEAQARARELEKALRDISNVRDERDFEASRADQEVQRAKAKESEVADLEKRLEDLRQDVNGTTHKLSAAVADAVRAKSELEAAYKALADSKKTSEKSEAEQQQALASMLKKLVDAVSAGESMHAAVCRPTVGGAVGLGIVLGTLQGGNTVYVEEILLGRGAAKTQMQVGDLVLAIDGMELQVNKALLSQTGQKKLLKEDAERMLVGSLDTQVNLRCQNVGGEIYEVQILRSHGNQGSDVDNLVNSLKPEACETAKRMLAQLQQLKKLKAESESSQKEMENGWNNERIRVQAQVAALEHESHNAAKDCREAMDKLRAEKSRNYAKQQAQIKCLDQLAGTVKKFVTGVKTRLAEIEQDTTKMKAAQDVLGAELPNFSLAYAKLYADYNKSLAGGTNSARTIEDLARQNAILAEKLDDANNLYLEGRAQQEDIDCQYQILCVDLESLEKTHQGLILRLDKAHVKSKDLEASLVKKTKDIQRLENQIQQLSYENEKMKIDLKNVAQKCAECSDQRASLEERLHIALRDAELCKQQMAQDHVKAEGAAAQLAIAEAQLGQKRKDINDLLNQVSDAQQLASKRKVQLNRANKAADDAIALRDAITTEHEVMAASLSSAVRAGERMHSAICRPILGGPAGLGVVLDVIDDQVFVAEILDGSPASENKMQPGFLVEIDDQPVGSMSKAAVENMLVGQAGTKVGLKVVVGDASKKPFVFELIRGGGNKTPDVVGLVDRLTPAAIEAAENLYAKLKDASAVRDDAVAKCSGNQKAWQEAQEKLTTDLDKALRKIGSLETQLRDLDADMKAQDQANDKAQASLRSEMSAAKKSKNEADHALDEQQKRQSAMAVELGELKALSESLREASESLREASDHGDPSDLLKAITDREREIEDVKQARDKLLSQMHKMASQLDEAIVKQSKLHQENDLANEMLAKLETNLAAATAEILTLKKEIDDLKTTAAAQVFEIEEQVRAKAKLDSELAAALKYSELEAEKTSAIKEDLLAKDAQLKAKRAEFDGLQDKLGMSTV